jgi:hypothetical protein
MTKQYYLSRICKKQLSYRRRHLGLTVLERMRIRENNNLMEELAAIIRLAEITDNLDIDEERVEDITAVIAVVSSTLYFYFIY